MTDPVTGPVTDPVTGPVTDPVIGTVAVRTTRWTTEAIAGWLLVSGGVLALVGNLLHPRFSGANDVDNYHSVSISGRLLLADLVLIAGTLLVTAGLVELAHLLKVRGAPTLGRLGRSAAVAGGSLAVLQFVLDGYAFRQTAKNFVAASDDVTRVGAFYATAAVDRVNLGLFSAWTLLLLAVTPLLLSAAMWTSKSFPTWLPAVGAVGGLGCLVTAVVDISQEDQGKMLLVFLFASVLVTAWVIGAGALLLREAPRPGYEAHTTTAA